MIYPSDVVNGTLYLGDTTAGGSGNVGDSSAFFPTAVSVVEYLLENDSPIGTHFTFTVRNDNNNLCVLTSDPDDGNTYHNSLIIQHDTVAIFKAKIYPLSEAAISYYRL